MANGTVILEYTEHHGQLMWKGRIGGRFSAIMVNTPEALLKFGKEQFPG